VQAVLLLPTAGGLQRITLDGAISAIGAIGLTSQILLLASLKQFSLEQFTNVCSQHQEEQEEGEGGGRGVTEDEAVGGLGGDGEPMRRPGSRKRVRRRYGGYTWEALIALFLVSWSLVLHSWAHCVLLKDESQRGTGDTKDAPIEKTGGSSASEAGQGPVALQNSSMNSSSWVSMVQAVHGRIPISPAVVCRYAVLVMYFASPLAHAGGLQMHKGYMLWQPFSGGVKFVCAQAIGWCLYALTLALNLLCLVNGHTRQMAVEEAIVALCPLSAIAPIMILVSLRYFDSGIAHQDQQEQYARGGREQPPPVSPERGRQKAKGRREVQGAKSVATPKHSQGRSDLGRGSKQTRHDLSAAGAYAVMIRSPEATVATTIATASLLLCLAAHVHLCPSAAGEWFQSNYHPPLTARHPPSTRYPLAIHSLSTHHPLAIHSLPTRYPLTIHSLSTHPSLRLVTTHSSVDGAGAGVSLPVLGLSQPTASRRCVRVQCCCGHLPRWR
jgi:hypothetical protein